MPIEDSYVHTCSIAMLITYGYLTSVLLFLICNTKGRLLQGQRCFLKPGQANFAVPTTSISAEDQSGLWNPEHGWNELPPSSMTCPTQLGDFGAVKFTRKRSVNGQSTLGKWVNRWSTNPHFRLTKNRPSCPAAAAFCCSCKEAARWICTACELEKILKSRGFVPTKRVIGEWISHFPTFLDGHLVDSFPMFQHFWMVIWLIHFPFSNIFGWS